MEQDCEVIHCESSLVEIWKGTIVFYLGVNNEKTRK